MTITKLTANKKIQHIKSVVANIFLYTRKIRSNKQEEDKSMTVTSASIILNEYMQQQQSNNATTVSRSSSGYKYTLVSKSMTTYKEEEDNDDQNSLTSTVFLPDEDDCYSTYSEVSSSGSVSEKAMLLLKESRQNVYSNFYGKLPNGNWLVRYRTRDQKVLTSYEIKSCMI